MMRETNAAVQQNMITMTADHSSTAHTTPLTTACIQLLAKHIDHHLLVQVHSPLFPWRNPVAPPLRYNTKLVSTT